MVRMKKESHNMKLKENAKEEDPRSIWEQQVKKEIMLKEGRTWKKTKDQKKILRRNRQKERLDCYVNHIKMKHRRKKIKKISNIKLVY
jgi:hypothetical protein